MNEQLKTEFLVTIRKIKQITRAELAKRFGVSLSLATQLVADLIKRGLLIELGKVRSSNGRPARLLALNPNAAYAIGIDISNQRQVAIVTNINGDVVTHLVAPPMITNDRGLIIKKIQELVERSIQQANLSPSSIAGVGLALWDTVDPVLKISYGFSDTPGWSSAWANFHVGEALKGLFPFPHLVVDDIVRMQAVAEAKYNSSAGPNFVYILADIGIGMAIMINGEPYIGDSHIAGEIAHIAVGPSDELCDCGNTGCLHLQTSILSILSCLRRRMRESTIRTSLRQDPDSLTIEQVFVAAGQGDKLSIQVLTEAGETLGRGLGIIVNLFGPSQIIIGGALGMFSDVFLDAAQRTMRMTSLSMAAQGVKIIKSELDATYSGAAGAAAQVINNLFNSKEKNILQLVDAGILSILPAPR